MSSSLPVPLLRCPFDALTLDMISGAAVFVDREDGVTKAQKPFARVTFRNATGMATVAVWAECLPDFVGIAVGAPVAITLTREVGRDGTPEWRYKSIRPLPPNHAVAKEALPSCPVPRAKLNARTVALVAALSPEARALFDVITKTPIRLADGAPLAPLTSRYFDAPAALSRHHAVIGGLWWHSLQVTELAVALAAAYGASGDAPGLDLDAIRLGGLLHDVGKVIEYAWTGTLAMAPLSGSMSHMGFGLRLVTEALTRAEAAGQWAPTPRQAELAEHLQHCIASHHGRQDWGAIVVPASREALLLHQADMCSSHVQPLTDALVPLAEKGWVRVKEGWKTRMLFASPTVELPAAEPLVTLDVDLPSDAGEE